MRKIKKNNIKTGPVSCEESHSRWARCRRMGVWGRSPHKRKKKEARRRRARVGLHIDSRTIEF